MEDELDERPGAQPLEPQGGPGGEAGKTAARARLLERFDAWLERVLADEEPPAGVAAELLRQLDEGAQAEGDEGGERFSLWSAMTALTQEVKLQGRAFGRLNESVSPLSQMGALVSDSLAAHRQALDLVRGVVHDAVAARDERDKETGRQAEERAYRSLLEVLLDLRDRLTRGLDLAQRHAEQLGQPGRLRKWLRFAGRKTKRLHEVTAALEHGYVLALMRLEETLERLGVREIDCAGRPFDPATMTATDVEENPSLPDGAVLEVYRAGYQWHGETVRPAQVRVVRSRRPQAKGPDDESA